MVIKIDEEDKQEIDRLLKGKGLAFLDNAQLIKSVVLAVFHGQVLTEGHGDLIDRKKLIEDGINKGFCDWYNEIKYAPTIIEADRSEEE